MHELRAYENEDERSGTGIPRNTDEGRLISFIHYLLRLASSHVVDKPAEKLGIQGAGRNFRGARRIGVPEGVQRRRARNFSGRTMARRAPYTYTNDSRPRTCPKAIRRA